MMLLKHVQDLHKWVSRFGFEGSSWVLIGSLSLHTFNFYFLRYLSELIG